ncbi:class I SAM-dependent methyltransferase [Thermomonospora umbrina]|uniref:Methyltransferase family protein n=1 Tax=Thermomonospora umbrina TaxID=111806 RepID=A0A3D9SPP9_9ACTN|nr:class I SAM-dependent methyltransferase [Thermomonospora umbrina]REE94915.1 methyltransferase family protein [Thermomonospora umbrina]
MTDYWNHNVHYHPVVLDAVPPGCRAALDVGCGEGLLARRLAARAERVTGLDTDARILDEARRRTDDPRVTYVEGGLLEHRPPPHGYDFISSVATVHHMDFGAAVTRMAELLNPGGTLVVIGLARDRAPVDRLRSAAALPAARVLRRRRGESDPVGLRMVDPGMSWGEVRAETARLLPGARWRRHLLWRYSIVWNRSS